MGPLKQLFGQADSVKRHLIFGIAAGAVAGTTAALFGANLILALSFAGLAAGVGASLSSKKDP